MTKKGKTLILAAIAWMTVAIGTTAAMSAELVWHFRSEYDYAISLEFYSQSRGHVWPGDNQVYVIRDGDVHDYSLSCNNGEKICYGAWVRNNSSSFWGSGYNGDQSCDSCCFTCGAGSTPVIVLNR